MHADDPLFGVFDDLEQQAAGLHLASRDAEVEELAHGEYAEVTLVSRLHGARGGPVRLRLWGGAALHGRLRHVGTDWLQVDDEHGTSWLVRTAAVTGATGLGPRAVSDAALPVTVRLSLRGALRALAAERRPCVLQLLDGTRLEGVLGRVGHDFVEVDVGESGASRPEAVPLRALLGVREQR